jgi:DNA polymerase-3 subunit delta
MVITVTGENVHGWQAELSRLVDAFVKEHGDVALERLDGEDATFERMREALNSLPFLASKKMVVLRAPSANKQFAEQAEQLLADVPESTDVVIVEPKLDKRLSYYKLLKKVTEFKEYKGLDGEGLAKWLVHEAKDLGGAISTSDARYLVERVGAEQQLVSNELDKLIIYNPKVTRETINLLTEPTPQSTIFELLEAAFAGNRKRTLELYGEQRALKVEPQQIVAMLTWQLHIVALIKAGGERSPDQIAKDAKLSPYVVKKSVNIARRLSLQDLKDHIDRLLNIDIKSKTTTYDIDEALQHFLLKLSV